MVISKVEVKPYKTLPGRKGLEQLASLGAVIKADDPRFAAAYGKWNAKISEPYRSRLDPEFLFSPRVDYLITQPTVLPTAMHETTFLVAEGVPPPELLHGRSSACFYSVEALDRPSIATELAFSRCDGMLASGPSQRDLALARVVSTLDSIRNANAAEKATCRTLDIDADSWFAGVALSEGQTYRPAAVDMTERQIDVLIKRPGKVALYLEMDSGRTNWHILPSPQTEITSIVRGEFTSEKWTRIDGAPRSVPIRPLLDDPSRSRCYVFNPGRFTHLGGPAIQALNASLRVLSGRELDSIVRKTNDGSWPAITPKTDAPRITVVIE
jgi:hypothetical protein